MLCSPKAGYYSDCAVRLLTPAQGVINAWVTDTNMHAHAHFKISPLPFRAQDDAKGCFMESHERMLELLSSGASNPMDSMTLQVRQLLPAVITLINGRLVV